MAAIPPPIRTLPAMAAEIFIVFRLTTKRAMAEAETAAAIDNKTVGQSYFTGTGSWSASMPM
jgi:hypothetical protein